MSCPTHSVLFCSSLFPLQDGILNDAELNAFQVGQPPFAPACLPAAAYQLLPVCRLAGALKPVLSLASRSPPLLCPALISPPPVLLSLQVLCFNAPLQADELVGVKQVVAERIEQVN